MKRRFPEFVVQFTRGIPSMQPSRGWPLAFVHINKTAGTTFSHYLNQHFESPEAIAPPYLGDMSQVDVNHQRRELFWGHFTYAMFRERRQDAWFITFLRDPVERVISQYKSLHNPKNLSGPWEAVLSPEHLRAMKFAHEATLDEFVQTEDPFLLGHLLDLQTAFLSSFRDRNHPQYVASALFNLERRFLFFGIVEEFEASIRLFQHQLSSSLEYRAEKHLKNVSPAGPIVLHPRTLNRIRELVEYDQVVYDHALSLMRERVRWVGDQRQEQRWRRAA